jgi:hypothetical protein
MYMYSICMYQKKGHGWLSCYGSTIGSNPDHSKIQEWGHKQRSVLHTLARQKNIQNIG